MVRAIRVITCDGSVVRTKFGRRASIVVQSRAGLILSIRVGVESHRRILDNARMIAIEPGTLWDVPASVFQRTSGLDAVVPSMAAVVSDVAGPSSTGGFVVLFHGDPRDARCVVVVGQADGLRNPAWDDGVDDLSADTAGVDFAAVGFAKVGVGGVEGVNVVDLATLKGISECVCMINDFRGAFNIRGFHLIRHAHGGRLLISDDGQFVESGRCKSEQSFKYP